MTSLSKSLGTLLSRTLPKGAKLSIVEQVMIHRPHELYGVIGPHINRKPRMKDIYMDTPVEGEVRFDHLAGLFTSSELNQGIISMTIRQAAYLFGLVRKMRAKKIVEIGRYKGGSTLVLAAACAGGDLWSIDIGEKVNRLYGKEQKAFDEELQRMLDRLGLKAHLLVGDSRTIQIDTGELDLVLIDGSHRYDDVKIEFERWGKRLRKGGALILDDAVIGRFHKNITGEHLLMKEIDGKGFRLVKEVDNFAHLERTD